MPEVDQFDESPHTQSVPRELLFVSPEELEQEISHMKEAAIMRLGNRPSEDKSIFIAALLVAARAYSEASYPPHQQALATLIHMRVELFSVLEIPAEQLDSSYESVMRYCRHESVRIYCQMSDRHPPCN